MDSIRCKTALAFIISAFLSTANAVGESHLSIDHNEANNEPEHISDVAVYIDAIVLPTTGVSNLGGNDAGGHIDFSINFDNVKGTLVLDVNNKLTRGHKVPAGMKLNLVLADGSKHLVGTTSGTPADDAYGFSYAIQLDPAAGVSASKTASTGPTQETYFRNALNVCMEQSIAVQTTVTILSVDQTSFSMTTQQVLNVGSEHVSLEPGRCK